MSHTKVFGSTRIHYNPDFSGEVTIQNDQTGERVSISVPDLLAVAEFIGSEEAE